MSRRSAQSIVVFVLVAALLLTACSSESDTPAAPTAGPVDLCETSLPIESADAEMQSVLLGSSYTGPGSYTVVKSAKVYNAEGNWLALAARVTGPGFEDGVTLFWRAEGRLLGGGVIVADSVTRSYSRMGAATQPGSEGDQLVEEAKRTPEGQAVIAFLDC